MNSLLTAALSDWELNSDLDAQAADSIQSAFESDRAKKLVYRGRLAEQNLYHVTRTLAGHPESIRLHVQRIYLAVICNDQKALTAALFDMNLVLKDRGQVLRRRILEQVSPMLEPDVLVQLQVLTETGEHNPGDIPLQDSVVANGASISTFNKL